MALSVGEDAANPYFCRRSAMPGEEEMSFYFKDVSHSGDYIPLHLRCRSRIHLSRAKLTIQGASANFTATNYNAMLSQWQFTATRSCALELRLCLYIARIIVAP